MSARSGTLHYAQHDLLQIAWKVGTHGTLQVASVNARRTAIKNPVVSPLHIPYVRADKRRHVTIVVTRSDICHMPTSGSKTYLSKCDLLNDSHDVGESEQK
jgi:hypothetical protein